MKVIVFREPWHQLARDYDLTCCSVDELVDGLLDQCKKVNAFPLNAAVLFIDESDADREVILKDTSTEMSMREVAAELLKKAGRDYKEERVTADSADSDTHLRDSFAGAALAGLLASRGMSAFQNAASFATTAYEFADAMLEARGRRGA